MAMDATWGSARKMVNRLPPTLTKVKLHADSFGDGGFSLLRPVRKYDGDAAERYCTFEAACAALLELGVWGPPTSEEALALRAKQLVNLKAKVDGLLVYKNRSTVYAAETGVGHPRQLRALAAAATAAAEAAAAAAGSGQALA